MIVQSSQIYARHNDIAAQVLRADSVTMGKGRDDRKMLCLDKRQSPLARPGMIPDKTGFQ